MLLKAIASLLVVSGGLAVGQTPGAADRETAPTSEPKKLISFDLSAIDKTADPCVDFYAYACGNWKKNNPIPGDQTRWGRFNELSERNNYLLYQDLKAAADAPKTPLQKKYGDYFAACMNQDLADKLGVKPIDPWLKEVAALKDKQGLEPLVAQFHNRGVAAFYRLGSNQDRKDSTKQIANLAQGGLGMPDRDYYLNDDAPTAKIRDQYIEHVTKMFVLLGDTPEQAAAETKNVLTVETALAKGSMTRVDLRDPMNTYHIMTVDELEGLSPEYKWKPYLAANQLSGLKTLNVDQPDFIRTMNSVIEKESLETLKSYLRWNIVHTTAPELSTPFVTENYNFFLATLAGQKEMAPRWKRCTAAADVALGEAVGQDWIARNFPPAAKQNMEGLVAALKKALAEDIQGLDWMSDATKAEAEKKLAAFRQKIGYPEVWRDYSKFEVKRDDRAGNAARGAYFNRRRALDKIGKPVDEKEWTMTPPTVNANYSPSKNDINFPAGILQPPFYDFKIDPAVNFGGIGVVIGHEMTHGFDDHGSQYDGQGNVRMWWTPEDKKEFDKRTDCEVQEYNGFEVAPGQNLNGKLTLGENTADNGGLHIAYRALMSVLAKDGTSPTSTIDSYTPAQRYFLGFAQVWCENTREQTARLRAKTDPHSSGQWRTNGSVQNFDEFGKAFSCKVGQPMMPEKSCRVW